MEEHQARSSSFSGPAAQETLSSVEINKVNTSNGSIVNSSGKRASDDDGHGDIVQQQPQSKKRKKCDAHEGAVPFRSSMIQLDDVRKLDQRLIVEGHLHYLPPFPSSPLVPLYNQKKVHLALLSDESNTSQHLFILLQGAWALNLVKDIFPSPDSNESKRVRLAFKEGKLVKDASGPENNMLIFSRGCEIWVCKASQQEEGGRRRETWKRYRTFAAAQNGVKEEERAAPSLEKRSESVVQQPQEAAVNGPVHVPSSNSSSAASSLPTSQTSSIVSRSESPNVRRHASPPDLSFIAHQAVLSAQSPMPTASIGNPMRDGHHSSLGQFQSLQNDIITQQSHSRVPVATRTDMSMLSTRLPPHQYLPISDIRKFTGASTAVSVIGLAITSNETKTTAKGDYSSSFKLVDRSCFDNHGQKGYGFGEGMTVTFMHDKKDNVPQKIEDGDVVLIRNIKTQYYREKVKITGFKDTNYAWAVAKTSSTSNAQGSENSNGTMYLCPNFTADMISPQEYAFARELHLWNIQRLQHQANTNDGMSVSSSYGATSNPGNLTIQNGSNDHAGPSNVQYIQPLREASRYKRLSDLGPLDGLKGQSALFDCVVEIVSPTTTYGPWLKIYVSDYSTHPSLSPHPELAYLDPTSAAAEGCLLVIDVWQDDFKHRLEHIARDLGEVRNIVEIRGVRFKPYGGVWTGHVGGKRPEFGWRIIKNDEDDPRKAQLLQAKKALFSTQENDLGARFTEEETEKDNSFADSGYDSVSAEDEAVVPKAGPSAGTTATAKTEQPVQRKELQKLSRSRKTLRLADLKMPEDPPDASCFFDCYCEIVEDVYDSYSSPVRLYVTDHNVNEVLFENTQHSAYPAKRIIFEIAFWDCPDKVNKIKHLKEGDRVFMENIRVKRCRSYNLVEGNVGSKGEFRVTILNKEDAEWAVLQKAQEMQASITTAEREREVGVKPKKEQVEYVKCERQAERIVGYNEIMSNKESAQYRLRGRVVAIDRPLEEILVNHCNACQQFMKYGSTACERCPPGIACGFSPKRWRFGLSIELEQPGRDISKDAVNDDMAVWVHVDEKDPDLVFMNGLQPTQANLPVAQSVLKKIVDNPSEENHTNPIFDFCAWSFPKQGVLLMIKTALAREGQALPWPTAEV